MSRGPLVLGDVGHCLARLSRARATSRASGFDIKEVLYPGFEGRPVASDPEDFLAQVELQVDIYRLSHKRPLVYATGLGALVLLAIRARGNVPDLPVVLQGPVPWSRAWEATSRHLRGSLESPAAKESLIVDHVHSPLDIDERKAFFSGLATCAAWDELDRWLTPNWFEALEAQLAARPPAIDGIRVWHPENDRLGSAEGHDRAVEALGADWAEEWVDGWGRFPYLDAPGPWVGALLAVGV